MRGAGKWESALGLQHLYGPAQDVGEQPHRPEQDEPAQSPQEGTQPNCGMEDGCCAVFHDAEVAFQLFIGAELLVQIHSALGHPGHEQAPQLNEELLQFVKLLIEGGVFHGVNLLSDSTYNSSEITSRIIISVQNARRRLSEIKRKNISVYNIIS